MHRKPLIIASLLVLCSTGAALFPGGAAGEDPPLSFSLFQTRPGDSLWKLAASPELYDDPWKWPLIYLLNRDTLAPFAEGDPGAIPIRILPAGTMLAVLPPAEAARQQVPGQDTRLWVLNVMSSLDTAEADSLSIRLMDAGCFTYFHRVDIDDKTWHRVRVGFFRDKNAAENLGRKLVDRGLLSDYWIVMAGREEIEEYYVYSQ